METIKKTVHPIVGQWDSVQQTVIQSMITLFLPQINIIVSGINYIFSPWLNFLYPLFALIFWFDPDPNKKLRSSLQSPYDIWTEI